MLERKSVVLPERNAEIPDSILVLFTGRSHVLTNAATLLARFAASQQQLEEEVKAATKKALDAYDVRKTALDVEAFELAEAEIAAGADVADIDA